MWEEVEVRGSRFEDRFFLAFVAPLGGRGASAGRVQGQGRGHTSKKARHFPEGVVGMVFK